MARKVMSAKGEMVDFDLLKIKQKITQSPKTVDVVARERFIDKRRRRTNRKVDEMLAQQEESKRYAEEAMKLQQDTAANIKVEETVDQTPEVESPKTDGKTNEKFKRKIIK
jgi:hypothetical protein